MANQLVDQYQNLPGVKVEYENGNLYSDHENLQANTKSVLVIGTALDGPVGQPVSVQAVGGPKAAEKLFGGMMKTEEIETGELHPETGEPMTRSVKVPHEGTLVRTMYELLDQGNEDVRLLRIDGKRAKTELEAQDIAQALEQTLGLGAGNVSFQEKVEFSQDGRLTSNPVDNIRELKEDGTIVKEYTGTELDQLILNVDTDAGNETIYFEANVFRPGHNLDVTFNLNQRTYYEVQRSDAAGVLTQSGTDNSVFTSTHKFWSDDVLSGHTINVFVDGSAIPQINSDGDYLWRPGSKSYAIEDELKDNYTTEEFKDGGLRFTSAYAAGVTNGTYPALVSGVSVSADYFYYDETAMTETKNYLVPGEDVSFELDYVPQTDDFKVYFEVGGEEFILEPKTSDNPNGDYTMVYPAPGSNDPAEVIVGPGVIPVGVKIKASYKTYDNKEENPMLIVEGIHAGEVYGSIENVFDPRTLKGVTVEVREDITAQDPSGKEKVIYFKKPASKQLTSRDKELVYRTRELKGVRTIRDFANFVNNDSRNNIVRLTVGVGVDVSVKGLLPTGRPIHLGEYKNRSLNEYELLIDDSRGINSPGRFPWLGDNGFFNRTDMKSMLDLYEKLGGKYQLVDGTFDNYELVRRGIYNNIENYKVDQIFLAEAMQNTPIGQVSRDVAGQETVSRDPNKNFATQLAQHCAVTTAKSHETVGYIGMEPVKNASLFDIQSYVDEVTQPGLNDHFMKNEASGELILNDEGEPIDIGHYISVIFGPEVGLSNHKLGSYVTSGAGIYAALRSTLPVENATTNKEIGINGLRYNLSEAQHNQLAGAHYVTFEEKTDLRGQRQFKVKDGVTASQPNSDYQRESTVSITHATVQIIRSIADPFIGLPNGLAQRNSLATEIQAGLDKLKERGVLQDFEFSIFTSQREKVLGNAFITLKLVPQFETRKIFTSVALRQSL